jgi:hypothetical protein
MITSKPIILYLLKLDDGRGTRTLKSAAAEHTTRLELKVCNYQFSNMQLDEAKATEGKNILCNTQDTANRVWLLDIEWEARKKSEFSPKK